MLPFCSNNPKEVFGVYPLWKAQGQVLIARWSFILKTLRSTYGRWTSLDYFLLPVTMPNVAP